MTTTFIVLATLFAGAALIGVLKGFNETYQRKFKHSLLSRNILIATGVATGVSLFGYNSLVHAPASSANSQLVIFCWLLIATAPAFIIWLVAYNIRKTSFLYGVGGSVLQIIVLPIASAWAVISFGLKLMWDVFCDSSNSKSTSERDNSDQAHQDVLQQDTQKTSSSYRFKNDKDSLY